MSKQSNKLKPEPKVKSKKHVGLGRGVARGAHMVLDGAFFTRQNTRQWLGVIFFLAFIGLLYISNSYVAEKKIREIAKTNRNIKELKFNYVQMRARLVEQSRPSMLAERLESYGIKPIVEPPNKIFLKPQKQAK
jgi:hypothetical protein